MSDESLRLVAEVVDKFTGPLRALRQGLQGIQSSPGMARVATDFGAVTRSVGNLSGAIRNTLVPALSAAGLAGLSVGGGLASISSVFATTTTRLNHLSASTGVAIQTMRELTALAPRIGIDENSVKSGLQSFSAAFDQIKRKQGETYIELYRKAPRLAEALVGSKSIDEALSHSLSFLAGVAKEKGPAQARLWSQMLFGTEDMAAVGELGVQGLRKALEEIRKRLGTIDPQAMATSKAFNNALHDMQDTAIGLRDAIGAEVLPMINELAKGARDFFDANKVSIRDGIAGFIKDVASFNWGEFITGIKETASSINGLVQSIGGWKTVLIGMVALKGVSLAAPVLGLAFAITKLTTALIALPLAKLGGMLGLMSAGGMAAGAASLVAAVAAALGMKAIADSRSKTLVPETNEQLEKLQAQRQELQGRLADAEKNGLGEGVTVRIRERIEHTDRELKNLRERLAKATEMGFAEGAEKAQPKIERETKGTFEKLKDWLSLSSMNGAPAGGGFMGAQIHRAALGASWGGGGSGYGAGRYGGGGNYGAGGYGGGGDAGYSGSPSTRVPSVGRSRGGASSAVSGSFGAAFDAPLAGGSGVPRVALPRFGPGMGTIGTPIKGTTFDQKAPGIIGRLMEDFSLTKEQAAGIVGNLGHESGGFKHMQEINPLGGGRGGFGWAQWTGPRRRQFEAWAKEKGLDPTSDEANYGFLRHELKTTERKSLAAVRGTHNARDATIAFESAFERSGVKAYGSRLKYASRALQAHERAGRDGHITAGPGPAWPSAWSAGDTRSGAVSSADGEGFDEARRQAGLKPSPGDLRYKPDSGVELLRKALRSGVTGSGINRVQGDASLRIQLDGFPRGTKTSTEFNGLFKEVSLNRGKAMPVASEEA
jgi:hypothetical protein